MTEKKKKEMKFKIGAAGIVIDDEKEMVQIVKKD